MRKLVVLPTYNERDNVIPLIRRIRGGTAGIDVLVVDDASPDGTAELVRVEADRDPGVLLVERPAKLGLGTAYLRGFQSGISRGYDLLIQMDCDFSHSPDALSSFVELIAGHDLVIGSRYVPGGVVADWNWFRRTLSRSANGFARAALGVAVRDLTGGFNGWRAAALERLSYETVGSTGYSFQIEMKYRACLAGLRWTEFPITFVDRHRGVSKIPRSEVVTTLLRVLKWRLAPPAIGRS
jgi:dolichol-phosphate mannosyltransferase